MKKMIVCMGLLILPLAARAEEITLNKLLQDMVSMDRLARAYPRGTRMVQFSSYDRSTKVEDGDTINWWANGDLGHYLRGERTARGVEYVMAEADGPGVLVRMWSANPGARIWRIYIDGSEEPVIEAKGKDLLGGEVEPWGAAFSERRNMGANFIFPLPFCRSIKVTVAHRSGRSGQRPPLMYYHVGLMLYPEDVEVESFSMAGLDALEEEIERVAGVINNPDSMGEPAGEVNQVELAMAPGVSAELFELDGPAAVKLLRIEVAGNENTLPEVLAKTLLTVRWDGEDGPSVRTPLGDFFGACPGAVELESMAASIRRVPAGAVLESRWVMPFKERALIELANMSGQSLNLKASLVLSPWQWKNDSLYFHADWREKNNLPTRPNTDMRMLAAKGRGHFAGLEMNVRNPLEWFWWGEGDEKVWVDGEEFPDIFGTGTEDYFGYAWCIQYLKFTHAYHGVSLPTEEPLTIAQGAAIPFMWEALSKATGKEAVVSQYRWHVLDPMPFDQSIRFYMEIMHHRKTEVDINATVFWYASPASEDDARPEDLSSREVWTP